MQQGNCACRKHAHVESPLRTELFVDSCSVRHQSNCCTSTREIPATWISIRTQGAERCACNKTAAFARRKHTWISQSAKRHVPAKRVLRSHAASTLGSLSVRKQTCSCDNTAAFARCEHAWISLLAQSGGKSCCILTPGAQLYLSPCARRPVHATTLLRSHAVSTLGPHSAVNEAGSAEKTAAFSRREHTWISLRAQKDMFRQNDCCALTPRAHLDLSPCASKKTCSCDRLLRSHATGTLGSVSVRKETCPGETTAAFSRREHTWISLRAQTDMIHGKDRCDLALPPKIDDFYLRTPDPFLQSSAHTSLYAIGNP